MIVGFTGTQLGMTLKQKGYLRRLLNESWWHLDFDEGHHGDCIGADEEFHNIVRELSARTKMVGHPPIEWRKRAFCQFDEVREPKEYLARNHDIVNECSVLVVAPKTFEEELRSGTWATVRYARKIGREIVMLEP